ncbi:hypothetical protein [Propionivibrio sp.]|uniref:hypothetical protein n=1 Tax=Propionivibrio sp. TaxID=2212460 RepID=UPI003BF3E971
MAAPDYMPAGAGTGTPRFSSDTSKPHPYRVRPHQPAASNATANLIASFEMAGHRVIRGAGDTFTVCKFGQSRYCKDHSELVEFAVKTGVKL